MKLDTALIPVDDLHFDRINPRLPERMRGVLEEKLLPFIAEEYNAIVIARSIASHGYFPSEPLIAVYEDGLLVVVEGNRRLAALKLLLSESLRRHPDIEDADEWEILAKSDKIPTTVPVIVAPNRPSVAPIIGFRHISGIEPWEPWAKARFIAALVEMEGQSFDQVAEMIGERVSDVRSHYRNFRLIQQARTDFDVDTERAEQSFGVFTAAMNNGALRQFIGVPRTSDVTKEAKPIPADRKTETDELMSWLFGKGDASPVIGESRHLRQLGEVVASEDGRTVLRATRDLEGSLIAAGGLRVRLLRRLGNARSNLVAASEDIEEYGSDEEVRSLLRSCAEQLQALSEAARVKE